jgi:D-glycero-alpha-D-manno-heptose-7-phosphate kinase
MELKLFQVHTADPISLALERIDANRTGAVFVVDAAGKVVGVATDGDIRRSFLKNHDVSSPISVAMNSKFVWAPESSSREQILKLLDNDIRLVPILSPEMKLREVVSRSSFPLKKESTVIARAKAPVRVSFGGGGTDLTHYFTENGGAVLNSTICLYTHAALKKRNDASIGIYSRDLSVREEFPSIAELARYSGPLSLITSLVHLIRPNFGFDLSIHSEVPTGSGLGGSSVALAAVIGCFNLFREDRWDNYEMAEIAFQAERLTLNIAGGWQDQYASIFGGFNFMEFTRESNVVHPLRIQSEIIHELEENLIFCHVGGSHESGQVHADQRQRFASDENIKALVEANKQITYRQKTLLLKGRLTDFGKTLHDTWNLKRQFSEKISSKRIDEIYDRARRAGALGGKLLGAGGGRLLPFLRAPVRAACGGRRVARTGIDPAAVAFRALWASRLESAGR